MAEKQQRGKGEGAIFQRSSGLWVARIELPAGPGGRRRKEITATTKDRLMEKLKEPRKQFYIHGDLPSASKPVAAWMSYWLDNIAAKRVRPNTLAGYRSVTKQITAAIGNIRLDKLQPAHIRRVHDHITSAGATSTYALNAHRVLARALKDAEAEGLIAKNPANVVDAPKKSRTNLSALTLDQAITVIQRAVPELDGTTEEYDQEHTLWASYLLTAVRRGELLGLEWDRVGDVLDLSWQLQRITDISTAAPDYEYRELRGTLYWTRPKTSAGWRIIPLVEPLRSILAAHRARTAPNAHGLVFTIGGQPIDPDTATGMWTAYAASVTTRKVRLHDLRHTTVDLLLEAGVPEDVVMEIVGHSQVAVTRQYKSREKLVRRTAAMNQLSALLGYEQPALES
ncbi:tyrosine-type recombinase/integrase [Microbacterium sp. No. 7]|uniref:tyrosine-type recombinase/integrase n=1 Tax=Microbacterium sp. No. 7 TaxID=1714373 RepID=UPI000A7AA7BA|nr:tyrosine-type recombinase/integrase [Microbacterium sp. No. 7]